ncbi:MAG: 16S rRNA (cytosine(1402)-N(4))-methyltransferase RsmH [Bacteroidota bacterium]
MPALAPMSSSRRSRRLHSGGAADASREAARLGGAEAGGASPYATGYHDPVLVRETVDLLVTDPAGVYVDGTLGGGGHTAALLDALAPEATVVGIDRDPEALTTARARLTEAEASGRFVPVHATFAEMGAALAAEGFAPGTVSGVLLDLGVSSRQLDAGARGFAYAQDGPLDMRMNPTAGESAADLVRRLPEADLADVVYQFGEERRSRALARAIKNAERMETTADLASVVRSATPTRDEVKTLARVFQALRIAVNDELSQIEAALPAALRMLAPGGRLAVIAYHSLEDRRAKRFLRHGTFSRDPEKDDFGRVLSPLRAVTRKPVVATEAEITANPRARSARLRVAETTSD